MFGWFGKRRKRGAAKARAAPRVDADMRLYAIGDIHGRLDLLGALLGKISQDRAAQTIRRPHRSLTRTSRNQAAVRPQPEGCGTGRDDRAAPSRAACLACGRTRPGTDPASFRKDFTT